MGMRGVAGGSDLLADSFPTSRQQSPTWMVGREKTLPDREQVEEDCLTGYGPGRAEAIHTHTHTVVC